MATDHDTTWTETLETHAACQARGFDGLAWLLQERPASEHCILLVARGGILRFCMAEFPQKLVMRDERTTTSTTHRPVTARFDNCEVRRYRLEWEDETLKDQGRAVLTEVGAC